eukprot:6302153-Prymnesium_polylepis.1
MGQQEPINRRLRRLEEVDPAGVLLEAGWCYQVEDAGDCSDALDHTHQRLHLKLHSCLDPER